MKKPRRKSIAGPQPSEARRSLAKPAGPTQLRIIGGRLRGRPIRYHGDPLTRPMKDRVREAVFNLVGPAIEGTLAIDLFAGTGALAIESLSRGARGAIAIERHFPSARIIGDNAEALGLADQIKVLTGDTFYWADKLPIDSDRPWVVYCSPPYSLYQDDSDRMIGLIRNMVESAPAHSRIVVESDRHFDFSLLDEIGPWDIRVYPPATIGIRVVHEA